MKNNQLIIFCFMLLNSAFVQSENYYLQAVNSMEISAEKRQESAEKVKEHKDIEVIDELEVPPFHKRSVWEADSLSRTFCTSCHQSPPHTKSLRKRAFLNMHTEYIACETCHLRPENIEFKYQWIDYRNKQQVKPSPLLFRQAIDKDDIPGKSEEKDRKTDKLIKIIPFYKNEPALILLDHDFAQQTIKLWQEGSFEEKVDRRAKIHAPLKEKGPECKVCHQKDQAMLNLQELGANNRQITRIQRHIVPQFFKRYTDEEQKIRINNLLK